jgi:hypothetical protein
MLHCNIGSTGVQPIRSPEVPLEAATGGRKNVPSEPNVKNPAQQVLDGAQGPLRNVVQERYRNA